MQAESSDNQPTEGTMPLGGKKKRGGGRGGRGKGRGVLKGRVQRTVPARVRTQNARRTLQVDREAAAANALAKKKEEMRESIAKMTEQQVRELLLRTVEKEPSLLQEIMEMTAPPQPVVPSQPVLPNQPAGPATGEDGAEAPGGGGGAEAPGGGGAAEGHNIVQPWCICTFCREMPTPAENLCCGKQPEQCISRLAQFQLLVLEEDVLDIAQLYRQDVLVLPADGDRNRGRRHAGYRQFTLWQHGRLGSGNRRVIPSCCVWTIRNKYPDRFGQYTGFSPGRLG